jgi:hypothetical protein
MGGLIAGIAVSTIASAISGAMGANAQKEAYEKLARASEQERAEFKKAYDQAYGEGSYNQQMQRLGAQAGQQFYDALNDNAAWGKYINGERAYVAPEDFSFTEKDFTDDPSYRVRLKEGLEALDQSNVASGLNLSGAAVKATNDYAQDQASKEFGAAYDRAFKRYTDDRNFDYNAWKSQADQYYNNLLQKLQGLGQVSNQGVQANSAQAQALQALANNNASSMQQQATAQGAANMAGTSATTSVLDAIAKGLTTGAGLYASQAGATPTAATPVSTSPANTYTLSGAVNSGGQDFAKLFLNGWNPAIPTTQNLVGA